MKKEMKLHLLEGRSKHGAAAFGSYWEKGEVLENHFRLKGETGKEVPMQTKVSAWWPDGSIKWAAHTADASLLGEHAVVEALENSCKDRELAGGIQLTETEDFYQVNTGKISMQIPKIEGLGRIGEPDRENGVHLTKAGQDRVKQAAESGKGDSLAAHMSLLGKELVKQAYPVLLLEHRTLEKGKHTYTGTTTVEDLVPVILSVKPEETGNLACVFRFEGAFLEKEKNVAEKKENALGKNTYEKEVCEKENLADKDEREDNLENRLKMPFVIRMYCYAGSEEIKWMHTFFFAGEEEKDYLKGMGIRFVTQLSGESYERHIRFATDRNDFHETAMLINCSYPRLGDSYLESQMKGEGKTWPIEGEFQEALENLAVWDRFVMCQDSATHYAVCKQTKAECCELTALQGERAPGVMAVWGASGGLMIGNRDFWQKYPAGLEADGLSREMTECTAWFYCPEAASYDFRHYDTRSYVSCYEGFEDFGASPQGIAVTSECKIRLFAGAQHTEDLRKFGEAVQSPAVYVGEPKYYHEKRAFGYWSLPFTGTPVEAWIEKQLSMIVDFYSREVENRSWYGLFDYGDFMHTYDPVRHCWKYDTGGFAWQNTELVPTYWLWLQFLRTGSSEAFHLAEAMSRHCSEVDFYHFGPKKGIGSRHNVRHWGCSCKEPRVAMAGHHRFGYYLTGDARLGDAMEDTKDADKSMPNLIHFHDRLPDGSYGERWTVRSGPDWISFVSNWMTQYERTLDPYYVGKIKRGLQDIENTPYGLASGPAYEYNTDNGALTYLGENDRAANMHLQVCMGGSEIWMELADMLEDEELKKLQIWYGRFYMLSPDKRAEETHGGITDRAFAFPYFAAAMAAYAAVHGKAAAKNTGKESTKADLTEKSQMTDAEKGTATDSKEKDTWLAKHTLQQLLGSLANEKDLTGFEETTYAVLTKESVFGKEERALTEIPWIKTNYSAQWCLNMIVALEFLREDLPKTLEELRAFLTGVETGTFHRA